MNPSFTAHHKVSVDGGFTWTCLACKGDLGIIPSCQKACFINPFVVKKTSGSFESLRNSCCLGKGFC